VFLILLCAISVIQVLLKVINKQGIFRLITFVSGFSSEVSYKCVVLLLLKLFTFPGRSNHKETDYFFRHTLSKEALALTGLLEIVSALEWKCMECSFRQFFSWLLLENVALTWCLLTAITCC